MKNIVLSVILCMQLYCCDMIVCSFNRPMQLYALLESIKVHVEGYNSISVICRSDEDYISGYKIVEKDFSHVDFYYQPNSLQCKHSFKPMMMSLLCSKELLSDYVVFAMDDMLVTDTIDLSVGKNVLDEDLNIYGFFYRLGKNITIQEFSKKRILTLPAFRPIKEGVLCWEFGNSISDWHFPNNLDFTMYRKSLLKHDFSRMNYDNPNRLEGRWQRFRPQSGMGACHHHSKTVNVPINIVTTTACNPFVGSYTTEELNSLFLEGKKIDLDALDNSCIHSVHQDISITFIPRD